MAQQLFHIYGPFSIQSFGLAVSVGFYTVLYLLLRHPKRKTLITTDTLLHLLFVIICGAIIGGRVLFLAVNWNSSCKLSGLVTFWDGGFSLLGGLIGGILCSFLFLKRHALNVLPMFDLLALHAPLMQSISRLGCFMAGCCYGCTASIPWYVTYQENSFAPMGVPLHPTQLYSAILLFLIFAFLYWYVQHKTSKTGHLFYLYLAMAGFERLINDYFRGDREFLPWGYTQLFSIHQLIAFLIIILASILLLTSYHFHRSTSVTQNL